MSNQHESVVRLTGAEGGADSSRDAILSAIRAVRPETVPLPSMANRGGVEGDLVARFESAVQAAAGSVMHGDCGSENAAVRERFSDAHLIARADDGLDGVEIENVDVLICRGTFGVAENGAVWLYESQMGRRAAPYLAQHLVLVVDRRDIVTDMHAAYESLDVGAEGFGSFIAGPSKTADIEQSLVIGAHGPRGLTVLLVR